MNIALPTILIFLFIFPGVVFSLYFYDDGEFNYLSFTKKTVISIIFSVFTQIIGMCLLEFGRIHFWEVFVLIAGISKNSILLGVGQSLEAGWGYLCLYFILIWLLPIFLAKGIKKLVLKWEWVEEFFLSNIFWIKVIKGTTDCDYILITAVVEMVGKGYLYEGFFQEFYLDKNDNLDRLVLSGVKYREIDSKKEKHPETFDDFQCILRYSDIKSLHIYFGKV